MKNAIERLRADHIDTGIALGHIDTDDCKPSCTVCASLAAVDALYQDMERIRGLAQGQTIASRALVAELGEIAAAAVRRVEGDQ